MFLIARTAQQLASWDGANGEMRASEVNSKAYCTESFSQQAERYGYNTRNKNSDVALHRQMDPEDPVLAERETSSTRGVAPSAWKCVAADAYQNSSQPRIRRIDRPAHNQI